MMDGTWAKVTTIFAFISGITLCTSAWAQEVLYVDINARPGGDGLMWNTAFQDLHDALDTARNDPNFSQIWVAAGTYKPDRGTGDRELSFDLVADVELLGGFAGNEDSAGQRDPETNVTVLFGDLDDDDEPGMVNINDNSHVIVQAIATNAAATIDGFTITRSNNQREVAAGGGLLVQNSEVIVRRCLFTDNVTQGSGGGIFAGSGAVVAVSDTKILSNLAFNGTGLCVSGSTIHATECEISDNQTGFADPNPGCGGGALLFHAIEAIFERCQFVNNTSFCGGAISSTLSERIELIDCTFIDNHANRLGGAVRLDRSDNNDAQPTIVRGCQFIGNVNENPLFGGGAIFATENIMTVSDCTFLGNDATRFDPVFGVWVGLGAVFVDFEIGHTFNNCLFAGNTAGACGGLTLSRCTATVTNSTFAHNTAQGNFLGVGLLAAGSSPPAFVDADNCILWGNRANAGATGGEDRQVAIENNGSSVSFSDIEGLTGNLPGSDNIGDEPLFVDADGQDDVPGTSDDDLRLASGSPCIDAANNDAVPEGVTTDLDGNPRFVDDPKTNDTGNGDPPIVDMGAYEFQVVLCPWDLDGSGSVGASDLLTLLASWGPCKGCPADFDENGTVGASDLLALLANWGPCP